jgi:cell division septum initiation protein DivIVA
MTKEAETRMEPVEIQHVKLRRRLFGYRRGDVDQLVEDVTASFEDVWFEREALRRQIDQLRSEVQRARERDRLVGDLMRSAQKAAEQTVAEARATAETAVAKARRKADEILIDVQRDPNRLREETRQLVAAEHALHQRLGAFVSVVDRALDTVDGDGSAPQPSSPMRKAARPRA